MENKTYLGIYYERPVYFSFGEGAVIQSAKWGC